MGGEGGRQGGSEEVGRDGMEREGQRKFYVAWSGNQGPLSHSVSSAALSAGKQARTLLLLLMK